MHKTLVCGHQLGRVLMASVDFNFGRALCGVLKGSVRLYLPFLSCRSVVCLTDFSIHVFETIFASIICQQLGDACFNYIYI